MYTGFFALGICLKFCIFLRGKAFPSALCPHLLLHNNSSPDLERRFFWIHSRKPGPNNFCPSRFSQVCLDLRFDENRILNTLEKIYTVFLSQNYTHLRKF